MGEVILILTVLMCVTFTHGYTDDDSTLIEQTDSGLSSTRSLWNRLHYFPVSRRGGLKLTKDNQPVGKNKMPELYASSRFFHVYGKRSSISDSSSSSDDRFHLQNQQPDGHQWYPSRSKDLSLDFWRILFQAMLEYNEKYHQV
ncbi:uncharacterized protein LOC141904733 [Tubulanus polymorphus]|uniref:uncharacterized protein LOC141904733 n=1 Tax=Tubulanus polymorphus TaxID=672921 RepID=UPI003DA6B51D